MSKAMLPVFVVNRIRGARMKMRLNKGRAGPLLEARQRARSGYIVYLGIIQAVELYR